MAEVNGNKLHGYYFESQIEYIRATRLLSIFSTIPSRFTDRSFYLSSIAVASLCPGCRYGMELICHHSAIHSATIFS